MSLRCSCLSSTFQACMWFIVAAGCFGRSVSVEAADGNQRNASSAEAELTPQQLEFFEKRVRPILVSECYDCHSGEEQNGSLSVESRAALLRGGDTGPSVVPEKPADSLLIKAIRYDDRNLQMPPQNRLKDEDIAVLEKWVAMGLPDPRTEAGDAPKATGMSIEEGRSFWSFLPIASSTVPQVQHADLVQTPIDAFLLSSLEERGLTFAPKTDKRSLIRRVTLNLTGLPPTVDEVAAFLADDSAEAFRNVVDRLLASPQYGVRWGRHWLDVARYADSNGLDENLAFGTAWRYRDYVVDAFNNDKPFDRFLTEQLAGDLLPDACQETQIATGFLSLGAKVLAEPDVEKLMMDTIDEQIDATGKAFLGMTLGCVRCHDHKFDPIKQTDYYALAAIFKSTRTFDTRTTGAIKYWYEHSFASDEEKKELKTIEAGIAKKKSAANSFKKKGFDRIRSDAQAKAADYLAAAADVPAMATLTDVQTIADQYDLHPRILHHCRTHLEFHRYKPFFTPWNELSSIGADAVRDYYQPLFAAASVNSGDAIESGAAPGRYSAKLLEQARAELKDPSGFLAVPPKVEYAFDQETLTQYYRLEEDARLTESAAPDGASAMGVTDQAEILDSLPIHIRGSHLNLGQPVARAFPAVMQVNHVSSPLPEKRSGRLELAQWMVSGDHPLTARVFVNRVWNWHFGRGLVASTENFGKLGDAPTHPELLDWLAQRFVESGWKVKELHRMILLSSAYQMDVTHPEEEAGQDADPENLLLWKFRLQRLDAEQLRDSLLAVSGRLDTSLGGKTVPLRNRQFVFNHTSVDHTKYDSVRRAIYLPVIRNNLYTLFAQFDFPDPTMPTGHRNSTVIAPQALLMMNAELVIDSAAELARQLLEYSISDAERITLVYETTLGRPPVQSEADRAFAFLHDMTADAKSATGLDPEESRKAWALLCQSLFASNEFMYVR